MLAALVWTLTYEICFISDLYGRNPSPKAKSEMAAKGSPPRTNQVAWLVANTLSMVPQRENKDMVPAPGTYINSNILIFQGCSTGKGPLG